MNLLPHDFRFAEPLFLLLLLAIPVLAAWRWWRRRHQPSVLWADAGRWMGGSSWRTIAERVIAVLPWLAFALLVVAMARPQSGTREMDIKSEGIDIIAVIDASGSMRAEDFQPNNRLFVAKQVAGQFVEGRDGDRIGVVVFAGEAFTQCPLTLDQGVLQDLIKSIDFGIEPDGTAIGSAIATAVNRLRESQARSKVIVLLTDGRNNSGSVDPITAADAAAALGIKIYTIGVGVQGEAPYPVDDPLFGRRYVRMPSDVDDETLTTIATKTGGLYFRATSAEALKEIYGRIDRLEKTTVESREYIDYADMGPQLLAWGSLVLALLVLGRATLATRLPA
jgi:Ca-activated chloride channel family protein